DGEVVAAERAHEEREEEEHAHAHPAREVDGARDPEGARVEPRGGVHARGGSGIGSGGRRRMREIVDGIFTWSWFSEPHGYDFNGYLIRHPEGNLCVDPVEPSADVLARLVQRGVARIVITNRNHVRQAALVALEVEVLLPGDGAPILRDAGARLRELVAGFGARG